MNIIISICNKNTKLSTNKKITENKNINTLQLKNIEKLKNTCRAFYYKMSRRNNTIESYSYKVFTGVNK